MKYAKVIKIFSSEIPKDLVSIEIPIIGDEERISLSKSFEKTPSFRVEMNQK